MKKETMFGFGIAALLLVLLAAAGAFAMPFGNSGKRDMFGNNSTMPVFGNNTKMPFGGFEIGVFGNNDAIKEALKNGDYEAYLTALEESWKAYKAQITEERFNTMVEQSKKRSDEETAMQEAREKIQQVLDNGNYAAWKEAVADSPHEAKLAEKITEENFPTFVEMQKAMQSGDFEKANELAEKLGLAKEEGFGKRAFQPVAGASGIQRGR